MCSFNSSSISGGGAASTYPLVLFKRFGKVAAVDYPICIDSVFKCVIDF